MFQRLLKTDNGILLFFITFFLYRLNYFNLTQIAFNVAELKKIRGHILLTKTLVFAFQGGLETIDSAISTKIQKLESPINGNVLNGVNLSASYHMA